MIEEVPFVNVQESYATLQSRPSLEATDEGPSSRRIFDLLVAGLGLVVFGPVLGVIALLIKLESPGPVLFRQTRVGKDEKPFQVYKFRSMSVATPDEQRVDTAIEDIEAFQFTPRGHMTAIGRAIRACSLDEMANLLNVIKGEMHIVGPRPDEPEIVCPVPARMASPPQGPTGNHGSRPDSRPRRSHLC